MAQRSKERARIPLLTTGLLLGLFLAGCGGPVAGETGGGGSGGTPAVTGGGGAGGADCQPTAEICDQKDNDCDGQIDNVDGGCACNVGETQSCYSGPDGTEGVGPCVGGTQSCDNGQWGPCTGEVGPEDEVCNNADDDCNGDVDDLGTLNCGVGACAASTPACLNGLPQTCMPGTPGDEVCDGIDNNCNNFTDESDPAEGMNCDTGNPGVCAAGILDCLTVGGVTALVCVQQAMPMAEECDGIDNDCNGAVDEAFPGMGDACSTGDLGVCDPGTTQCVGGAIQCVANVMAAAEACDGLDNDCNGAVDDGNPGGGGACNTGLPGVCSTGTLTCMGGALQCVQNTMASAETCDGLDNNCNGASDEGNPGGGGACGCGGTLSCTGGSLQCVGMTTPTVYFTEDFANNLKGWTLGNLWQIAPAVASPPAPQGNPDPGLDHTPTADNGIAGMVIGGAGTLPTTPFPQTSYLTSPNININVAGPVYLRFWRWLNTDYPGFMDNFIEVSNNGGTTWTKIWSMQPGVPIFDASWQNVANPAPANQFPTQFDVTAYKSTQFRVRFGWSVLQSGAFTITGWNIDDIALQSQPCP